MTIDIRLAGSLAALNHEHPLCNPFLSGPEDSKNEWLLGYSFAMKLSELDKAKLRVAIMERAALPADDKSEGT